VAYTPDAILPDAALEAWVEQTAARLAREVARGPAAAAR
jgi:hypothetical protein